MNTENHDLLGKRIAGKLDELELPAHVSARLAGAREAALARARQVRDETRVVSPSSLALNRLAVFRRWAVVAGLAVLAGAFLVSENVSHEPLEFDWTYHVHADSSEDLVHLFND